MNKSGVMTAPEKKYFYRFYDQRYAPPVDEFGDSYGRGQLVIHPRKYRVLKRTEKSVFLQEVFGAFYGDKRWMRLNARKRFAAETIEEALFHFMKRKEKQMKIYKSRMESTQEAFDKARVQFNQGIANRIFNERTKRNGDK